MSRIHLLLILSVGLMLTRVGFGDPQSSPSTGLKTIRTEVADAQAQFYRAQEKLSDEQQDDPEVDRLRETAVRKQREGFVAALQIAQAEPQSDVGFEALEWLLLQAPTVYSQPAGKIALELMVKHHAANPNVGRAVARVAYFPPYGLPHDA